MRESIGEKAGRYRLEGRLVLRRLDEHAGVVDADCRGNGAVYALGHDESGWFCNCAARGDCAHLEALRRVVGVEPREDA
jgi:hypothetical protein